MNNKLVNTDINERIKYLRKSVLELTQDEFSQMIQLKRTTIGNIEANNINVTDRNIKTICDTFGINETWVRTGDGPIHISLSPDDELPQLMAIITSKSHGDPVKQQILVEILKLLNDMDESAWEVIIKFSETIAKVARPQKIEE